MAQAKARTKKVAKKTAKKHPRPKVADDVQPVTINSRCSADPQSVHLGGTYKHKIQFHCGAGKTFVLVLDGGVFIGQPLPFPVFVAGPDWVPNPPLEVETGVNDTITNYVWDLSGTNCHQPDLDNPPDIIIQN